MRHVIARIVGAVALLGTLGLLVRLAGLQALLGPAVLTTGILFVLSSLLQSLAAGAYLRAEAPYEPGEVITALGITGTVTHIGIRATHGITLDYRPCLWPNAALFGSPIVIGAPPTEPKE